MPKLVLGVIHINRPQELFSGFLVVNELTLRNYTRIQHFVPTKKSLMRQNFSDFS